MSEPDWTACFLQLHANDSLNHTLLADLDPNSPIATPEQRNYAELAFRENCIETDCLLGNLLALGEEKEALLVLVSDHPALPVHTWIPLSRGLMGRRLMLFRDDGAWDPAHNVAATLAAYLGVEPPGQHEGQALTEFAESGNS